MKDLPPSKRSRSKWWRGFLAGFTFFFVVSSAVAEETTVEMVHYFNVKDQTDGLNAMIAEFEKSHPDIKVQLTYVPFAELVSRVLQMAAVRKPPAIAAIDNPDVLRVAKAGILKDTAGDLAKFGPWKEVYPGPKNAVVRDEKAFGYPYGHNSLALCLAMSSTGTRAMLLISSSAVRQR